MCVVENKCCEFPMLLIVLIVSKFNVSYCLQFVVSVLLNIIKNGCDCTGNVIRSAVHAKQPT